MRNWLGEPIIAVRPVAANGRFTTGVLGRGGRSRIATAAADRLNNVSVRIRRTEQWKAVTASAWKLLGGALNATVIRRTFMSQNSVLSVRSAASQAK